MYYNVALRRHHAPAVAVEKRYYIFVCVCVCVCLRARVRPCVRARGRLHARVCAGRLVYPACNTYAQYCDVMCCPFGSTIFFDTIS